MNTTLEDFKSQSEIRERIRTIISELESRHKFGVVKISKDDGSPIPTKDLQEEMYKLSYRLSILLSEG